MVELAIHRARLSIPIHPRAIPQCWFLIISCQYNKWLNFIQNHSTNVNMEHPGKAFLDTSESERNSSKALH